MDHLARLLCLSLLLWCLCPPDAAAGPWPREAGAGFTAQGVKPSWPLQAEGGGAEIYSSFYLEYGLRGGTTLGLDLGRGATGKGKVIAFLRRPVPVASDRWLAAVTIGAGRIDGAEVLRPGLSLGRGVQLPRRSEEPLTGWLSLDAFAEHYLRQGRTDLKIDVTLGVNHRSGRKYMLQLQAGRAAGARSFLRLAPSVAIPLRGGRHLEAGLSVGLAGEDRWGVTLGLWREF
ncbi:hypothetical protein E0K89_003095 [Aquicoccus sp. SCR17]|nr:hypothetical protein [Carideicomes alvinocaridis]